MVSYKDVEFFAPETPLAEVMTSNPIVASQVQFLLRPSLWKKPNKC